jgi:hypothetical protein
MLRSVTIEHRQKEAATVDRAADTRLPKSNNNGRIFEDGVGGAFWKSGTKREAHSSRPSHAVVCASHERGPGREGLRGVYVSCATLGVTADKHLSPPFCVSYFILRKEFPMS